MNKEEKEILKNIVEMIEDKNSPGRRGITDYVVMLFHGDKRRKAEEFINELYDEYDSVSPTSRSK
jgi:hypothetical protein